MYQEDQQIFELTQDVLFAQVKDLTDRLSKYNDRTIIINIYHCFVINDQRYLAVNFYQNKGSVLSIIQLDGKNSKKILDMHIKTDIFRIYSTQMHLILIDYNGDIKLYEVDQLPFLQLYQSNKSVFPIKDDQQYMQKHNDQIYSQNGSLIYIYNISKQDIQKIEFKQMITYSCTGMTSNDHVLFGTTDSCVYMEVEGKIQLLRDNIFGQYDKNPIVFMQQIQQNRYIVRGKNIKGKVFLFNEQMNIIQTINLFQQGDLDLFGLLHCHRSQLFIFGENMIVLNMMDGVLHQSYVKQINSQISYVKYVFFDKEVQLLAGKTGQYTYLHQQNTIFNVTD